jgi:Glycosyltransferase family 87
MLCAHLLVFYNLREPIQQGYPDFSVFYTAATMLRQGLGRDLYDWKVQYQVQKESAGKIASRRGPLPYIHPPFEALLFLPLTLVPYRLAFILWDLLNGIALFAVALILRRRLHALQGIPSWEFVLGFLAFFPVFAALLQGQDSILLLLLVTLGFEALKRRADFAAGCWFGLGAFKFQLIVPLVLLLILWRRRRAGAGFVVTSLALALLSVALVGWQQMLQYPAHILQIVRSPGLGGVPPGLMPNLRGLVEWGPSPLASAIRIEIAIAASAALFLFGAASGDSFSSRPFELRFSLAVVIAVLVSWHTNAHDLSLLILPLVLLADYSQSFLKTAPKRKLTLMLPALPLLVSPLWVALWLKSAKLNLISVLLLWWCWEIGREITRASRLRAAFSTPAG